MRPPKCHRLAGRPTLATRVLPVAPRFPLATTRRCAVRVVADLSARGRPILPKSITVQRIMGEGSFGQVFEGFLSTPTGDQRVVMKRVKTRVQGAEEMSQMEHLLNVYASRVARGHCADFLGYCEVADSEANSRLTSGLWLVWKYEGSKTLSYYLRRRDTIRALAADLEVSEGVVVPTVMRHIFEGLAAFHAAGLVHRDVKPLNMILADDTQRFKLIDLGACADLRTGTNYVPEESILDLNFCPPEQFVMPTDSPHIAKQAGLFRLAISPLLWAKHKPDRFDTWSAGIVMLQLAVGATRTDRALRNFNAAYGPKYKYDLAAWRKGIHLPVRDCVLLDADDGAGWELLQSLLAPRHIQVDDNGGVSFVNDSPFQRISAFEALKHRYIKGAVETAAAAATSSPAAAAAASSRGSVSAADAAAAARKGRATGEVAAAAAEAAKSAASANDPLGSALGMWRDMTGRLFDLEARIMRQTSATELQTTTVKRLKEQVDSGKVDPALLQKEEKVLSKMQTRLAGLQQDFSATASQASGIFSFFGFGANPQAQQAPMQQQQSADLRAKDKAQQNLQALRSASSASSAAASASSPSSSSLFSSVAPSAADMFSSVWERLSSRLGDLERKISNQASATERQSLVVRGLRAKVKTGEAEPEMLVKAERTLSRMERRLLDLDRDYWAAKQNAKGALAGNLPVEGGSSGRQRPGSREQSVSAAEAEAATRTSDSDNESSGSFWSRLLGSSRSGSSGSSMDGSSKEAALKQAAAATNTPTPPQQQPVAAAAPPPPRSWSPIFHRSTSPIPTSIPTPIPTPARQQAAPPTPTAPPQQQPGGQQPQQAPPVYRSIFGALSGLAGGSQGQRAVSPTPNKPPTASTSTRTPTPSPLSAAAAAAAQRALSPMRAASPRSGGGFLGGLFGRPPLGGQQPPEPAAPAASGAAQPVSQLPRSSSPISWGPQAAAAASPSPSSASSPLPAAPSSPSSSSSSGLLVPLPAAPSTASGGDALLDGANRVIRNSLSFTGMAAKIAGDMATAFKADAERYMKDLELQEAAKRQQRTLDLAFLALLREAHPPVSSGCSFEAAADRFGGEASWEALAGVSGRRQELFGKYLQTARRVEEQAAAAADAAFRAALRRYVSAGSRWEDFQGVLEEQESDPAVAGVQDVGRRQQLFTEVVAELQLQAVLQAASMQADVEFTSLLAELREPPVTSSSTWPMVRRVVAADPRCQPLPERRRRELFETFTARLLEEEAASTTRLELEEEAAAAAAQAAELDASAASQLPITPTSTTASVAAPTEAAAVAPAALAPPSLPDSEQQPLQPPLPVRVPPVAASAVAEEPVAPAPSAEVLTAAAASPPASAAAAYSSAASAASLLLADDDDLSAALAGMEAALETAMRAVASAPTSSSFSLGGGGGGGGSSSGGVVSSSSSSGGSSGLSGAGGGGGGNNVVSVPPSQFHGGAVGVAPPGGANGVARKASPGGGGTGAPAAGEGLRLDELRREQARLRTEYEAMASRLREMEERLKGQAHLISSTSSSLEGDEQEAAMQLQSRDGGGEEQPGSSSNNGGGGNGLAHSGSDDTRAPIRGGQRWR